MKWEEQVYQLRREWQATPCATHAIDIWEHDKEGYSWCVGTDDGADDTPEGWSATLDDAKRHAEAAYREWCLEQPNGTAEFLVQLHQMERKLADLRLMVDGLETAAHEERAAVVAWLQRESASLMSEEAGISAYVVRTIAGAIERGEHRREEGA